MLVPRLNEDVEFKPQPGPQELLLTTKIRHKLFGGSRGGGKSFAAVLSWVQHEEKYGRLAAGLVVRRSYPELEQFIQTSQKILPLLGYEYKVGAKTWVAPSGALLKLRFLETDADADKYQGFEYTWICIEEVGNFKDPAPIDKISATNRSSGGVVTEFMMTANPGGPGHKWLKQRYIDRADPFTPFPHVNTGLPCIYIPSRVTDNPALLESDPTYVEVLKGTGPAWLVKAWLEGDWSVSPSGNVFLREYWKYYKLAPNFICIAQSWDTAFKDKQTSDYSACTTWGVTKTDYYLLDVWRGQVQFPELKKIAVQIAEKWKPQIIYVEDRASGQSLIQELKRETRLPIRAVQIDRDKIARAYAVTPLIEAGKVLLPESAPWLHDFVDELSSFPNGSNDDQVDSVSQALDRLSHYTRRLEAWNAKVVPIDAGLMNGLYAV